MRENSVQFFHDSLLWALGEKRDASGRASPRALVVGTSGNLKIKKVWQWLVSDV
jgi:hypothetical protein